MNWRKWCDEFALAGKGILLACKEKRFWYGFIPSFIFFGTLMNLLAGGTSKFELMGALGFPTNLQIIGNSFLSIFGVGQPFLDWLPIFAIALLQGILIGIIVLLWDKKRTPASASTSNTPASKSPRNTPVAKSSTSTSTAKSSTNSENIQKAGLITGLIALGAGCPTCGVTLLTPLIGAIFSTGSLAIAGTVSSIVTILAVVIAILALKRLGVETYVIIVNEKYLKKQSERSQNAKIS